MFKRILASDASRTALTWIAAQYIRLVWLTGKWQIFGEELPDKLIGEGQPFIVAFWHGRLIMMAFSWNAATSSICCSARGTWSQA